MIRFVTVESPYASDPEGNWEYLSLCIADCVRRGENPYASHRMLAAPSERYAPLDDRDPAQRVLGIDLGLERGDQDDARVFYVDLGVSRGMRAAFSRARRAQQPVEFRSLNPWGKAVPGEDTPKSWILPPRNRTWAFGPAGGLHWSSADSIARELVAKDVDEPPRGDGGIRVRCMHGGHVWTAPSIQEARRMDPHADGCRDFAGETWSGDESSQVIDINTFVHGYLADWGITVRKAP